VEPGEGGIGEENEREFARGRTAVEAGGAGVEVTDGASDGAAVEPKAGVGVADKNVSRCGRHGWREGIFD
jgi:hypothetical protein